MKDKLSFENRILNKQQDIINKLLDLSDNAIRASRSVFSREMESVHIELDKKDKSILDLSYILVSMATYLNNIGKFKNFYKNKVVNNDICFLLRMITEKTPLSSLTDEEKLLAESIGLIGYFKEENDFHLIEMDE